MTDDFDEEAVARQIDDDARARRADPLAFFCEIIDTFLRENDVESFLTIWRSRAVDYRAFADDALLCFERIAADPPANLAELLFESGGFKLFHIEPARVAAYTPDEVVGWLRALVARMRAIHRETAPPT